MPLQDAEFAANPQPVDTQIDVMGPVDGTLHGDPIAWVVLRIQKGSGDIAVAFLTPDNAQAVAQSLMASGIQAAEQTAAARGPHIEVPTADPRIMRRALNCDAPWPLDP